MNIICNAFSIKMLPKGNHQVNFDQVDGFPKDCVSFVGHQDTANMLGVECHRGDCKITRDDVLYVAQYVGPRLPEGATTLPEGAQIEFYRVTLV